MKKKLIKTDSNIKTTKTERRKKFSKWIDMNMYRNSKGVSAKVSGIGNKQDWICDICGKKVSRIKRSDGIWRCENC